MRTLPDVVHEIQSVKKMVANRQGAGGETSASEKVQQKLVMQISKAIQNLPLVDSDGSALLFEAIADMGSSNAHKQILTNAADDKLVEGPDDEGNSSIDKKKPKVHPAHILANAICLRRIQRPSEELRCEIANFGRLHDWYLLKQPQRGDVSMVVCGGAVLSFQRWLATLPNHIRSIVRAQR